MRDRTARIPRFQRHPSVRLRRESWGGFAFQRDSGDLLELDAEGFDVAVVLGSARTLRELGAHLTARGHRVRLPELAAFVQALEAQGIVLRNDAERDGPLLAPDLGTEEDVPELAVGLRAPLVAHWAVSYRCNLRCAFCYSESGPGREPGPDPATRERLVERLAAWGVLEVALGGGEPTAVPAFAALLASIRAAGMVPNVTTNGTIDRPEVIRALADHAGVVHLSADSPERLDDARGPGVFERVRQTARALGDAGARLGINVLLTPHNIRDLPRTLSEALALGARSVTLLRPKGHWAHTHWPGFPGANDLEAAAEGLRSFIAERPPVRLYVDTALRGEWAALGLLDDPEPDVLGCGGGQRHVAITPEGDVYPCSHTRHPAYHMGHLLTEPLDQLWTTGPGRNARLRYLQDCEGTQCACQQTSLLDASR